MKELANALYYDEALEEDIKTKILNDSEVSDYASDKLYSLRKEIRLLNEQNREYQVPLPEEELLLTYFRPTFPGCQGSIFMKVSEILERINVGVKQQLSPNKLGMLLTKLGFQKARYNNERGYLVIERSLDEISASRKLAAQNLLEV
jgi:hypothetical protein